MCKFLKEEEIRILATRAELQEAIDFYECHDKWVRVKAKEVKAFGATNFPLFLSEIKEMPCWAFLLFQRYYYFSIWFFACT